MPKFSVTGDVDPFLHVSLAQGEKIYCESDAMVMMEATLDLKGKVTGGIGAAIMRRFANGESFFQQHIEAVRGGGDCLHSSLSATPIPYALYKSVVSAASQADAAAVDPTPYASLLLLSSHTSLNPPPPPYQGLPPSFSLWNHLRHSRLSLPPPSRPILR